MTLPPTRYPEVFAGLAARARAVMLAGLLLPVFLVAACDRPPAEPATGGSVARVRLMTAEQYRNTIAYVFGQDVADSVLPPLPPLARTDGLLASGAAFVGVTSDQVSQIQQAAAFIAARVVDERHRGFLLSCEPLAANQADAACAAEFLRKTGRLLYRRPLNESHVAALVDIANSAAAETGSFYEGLALALETALVSPDALFIVDRVEEDPGRAGELRLDAFSLASRLSYFFWNAAPDDELLSAAESGELQTAVGLERAVERLLASSRLEDGVRAFFDDMLQFDEFDSLAKDPMVYPRVTAVTLADAREQTLRTVVDHLLAKDLDYRDLFTTRATFMSMHLAPVYDTPTLPGWVPFTFAEDGPRRGLLTHVSFLAANSHAVRSSPTLRGRALREVFLCQKVPDPPPNVDFSALEDAGDVPTARERLEVHNTNPSCAGCHLITDPMGLSLENFDGAGIYRETEHGAILDVAGELDGVVYDDVAGLTEAMRNHPKLPYCLVNRLYAYGTGGPVSLRHDRELLDWFEQRFEAGEFRLRGVLRDIALSRTFRTIRPREETVADTFAGSGVKMSESDVAHPVEENSR